MTKAKLFMTGGSQAVRLPAEFRFEGDEVDIRRDSTTGDVVLSKPFASWEEYFDWVRTLELPRDFLEERNQPEDDLRDPLPRRRLDRRLVAIAALFSALTSSDTYDLHWSEVFGQGHLGHVLPEP